jgi:catechol 2,3-dioxygenase-like lactoylglutathione lyase family enzyme
MAHIEKLGRVMVPVSDQEAAIAWYRDKLGFDVVVDIPYAGTERWVEVAPKGGGTTIALVKPMGAFQPGHATGIGLEAKDVRALHADLKEKGVEVDGELMGGDGTVPLLFGFRDGDGNNLMVAEVE